MLIVGLAPGLKGANRTGRPFTGDYAGDLLYATLAEFGFSEGVFAARPDDGLRLKDAIIANAVRCVPPENKPTPAEINACRPFLTQRVETLPRLRAILALGRIAHDSTARALGMVPACPSATGADTNCRVDNWRCSIAITARATTRTPASSRPTCSGPCSRISGLTSTPGRASPGRAATGSFRDSSRVPSRSRVCRAPSCRARRRSRSSPGPSR